MFNWSRLKWWSALIQAIALVAALALPAFADTAPTPAMSATEQIALLQQYNIIRGDETGNLNLDKSITRAEMTTIMVRAIGKEQEAELFKGSGLFVDSKGHWADGYLSFAKSRQLLQGDGNNFVRPQDAINYAEALTLLLRVAGKEPTTGEWPTNVLMSAIDLGLVPNNVSFLNIRENAIRGLIFGSLAKAITTVKLPSGKTILQTYIATVPPILTLNTVPTNTTQPQTQVSGTTKAAVRVTVNGTPTPMAGQTFSASVDLIYGENTISVIAEDRAGNQATQQVKITRVAPVSKLEITGPSQVRKGGTATYQVVAYDQNGVRTSSLSGVTASVEGNIGSFNIQTGVMTASANPGKGQIVVSAGSVKASINVDVFSTNPSATQLRVRPVNGGKAVSFTQEMTVEVEVLDQFGRALTDDFGRSISLNTGGISGLVVTPASADTSGGVATFKIRSSVTGTVTLLATSGNVAAASGVVEFGTNVRVRLNSDASSLVVGSASSATRIYATLVNEQNQPILNNTGSDIRVQLSQSGTDGLVTDPYLTILRGTMTSTSSGDDGMFNAGASSGSAIIIGTVTSGQGISVDSTSINVSAPQTSGASKWELIQPGNRPTPGTAAFFSVRMADAFGNTVPGSFAFQLEVSTSNNEPKINGIPQGVSITLGSTGLNPVSDGIAEGATNDGSDIIVRTNGGIATFNVNYDKVGQVNVKVVGMPGTSFAYWSDGTIGAATSGQMVASSTFPINYTTTPTAVKLLVDSPIGKDQTTGAASLNGGQPFTLRAYFIENTTTGRWVPGYSGTVTLKKKTPGTVTMEPAVKTIQVTDGKAEFTVLVGNTVGIDEYEVTGQLVNGTGLGTSNTVTLMVQSQSQAPATPTVLAARGMNGMVPGTLNYVSPTDTGLEFEIASNGTPGYASVNVYQEGYSVPLYTSAAVDMSSANIRVVVPKDKLQVGKIRYQLSVRNGYGESARTTPAAEITTASVSQNILVSNARYDRVSRKLFIYGTGFGSSTLDVIGTYLLNVSNGGAGSVNLGNAVVSQNTYGQITLDLPTPGADNIVAALNSYSGAGVVLNATEGWYTRTTGEIAAVNNGKPVSPMGLVNYAVYDRSNRRLLLTGGGFNTGTLNTGVVSVTNGTKTISLAGASTFRTSDAEWVISLAGHPNVVTELEADAAYTLSMGNGWFYDVVQQTAVTSIPIFDQLNVTSVGYDDASHTLTINGSGFSGWEITPSLLSVADATSSTVMTRALSGTKLPASTDTQLLIQMDATAQAVLEGNGSLKGSNLYLISSPGWASKTARRGAPIPLRTLRFAPR